MFKYYQYNSGTIIYSVVIPIYNQEDIILDNLQSIIKNTLDNFEIILILDFCFDDTEKNIIEFLENYHSETSNFIQITIFKNEEKPLFETKCDNIGFKHSAGIYCIEIQADMKMIEMGYNLHLVKPFNLYDNIIAVSGRCAHNLYEHTGVGKLGNDIEKSISELNVDKNKFYIYETCNRGPLMLDRKKLEELNYLDEENYFLDDSDHDLMARAYIEKKYICGYVPIDFDAPLHLGSTRNVKMYDNSQKYIINNNELNILRIKKNNTLGINKYKSIWQPRIPIVYDI